MDDKALSKNAQKRLLKAERFAALKVERRARDKQKKKDRVAKRREEREGQEPPAKRAKVTSLPRQMIFGARVVIDLGFDALMSEKVCWRSSEMATQCNKKILGGRFALLATGIHI